MSEVKIDTVDTTGSVSPDKKDVTGSSPDYMNDVITKETLITEKKKLNDRIAERDAEILRLQGLVEGSTTKASEAGRQLLQSSGAHNVDDIVKLTGIAYADVDSAKIEELKKSHAYMFHSEEPAKLPTGIADRGTTPPVNRTFREATLGLSQAEILEQWPKLKKEFGIN